MQRKQRPLRPLLLHCRVPQVHDELLYEVAECRLADVARLVAGTMSGAWQLRVPLRVKCR